MQTPVEIGPSNASQVQHRRKDATEQMKNLTLARTRTQVLGISSADALPLSYGCQWAEQNFCPNKLSNLKFTPLHSIHVDFYSRHDVNSVLFFLHYEERIKHYIYVYIKFTEASHHNTLNITQNRWM